MKKFKRTIVALILAGLAISLASCKIVADGGGNHHNSSDAGEEYSQPEPSSYAPVEGSIGQAGGTLSDGNITINIPANALSVDTPITAQYATDESQVSDTPFAGFLGAVEFGPSGTTFAEPVQVTMKLTDAPRNEKICIFCYDEEEDIWDFVTEASVSGGNASFSVNHFSYYKALDLTPAMTSKWDALVRTAIAEGYSDSWILDTFVNYLLNEEYVLDYYTEYQGLLYEPIGLFVSGNYFVNGKEGDSNDLITMVGESNQVGNRYGLSRIASETDSYQEYKKEKDKPASERKDITSVMFNIDYKMIKPNIEASADKNVLAEGETATVSVYTHYVNPTNHFPEFRDVVLPYYPLTLPYQLVHLRTSTDHLITDEGGNASFTVTSLDGEAEMVKIMFYIEGVFGEYADAYVAFNASGYDISGHIKEIKQFSYVPNPPSDLGIVTTQTGTLDLVFEYDFTGKVKEDENNLAGSINLTNFTASVASSKPWKGEAHDDGDSAYYTFGIYDNVSSVLPANTTFSISGSKTADNKCTLSVVGISQDIAVINGSGTFSSLIYSGSSLEFDDSQDHTFALTIGSGANALLEFLVEEGTQESTSGSFKDTYSEKYYYDGVETPRLANWDFTYSVESGSTIQTITITPSAPQQ